MAIEYLAGLVSSKGSDGEYYCEICQKKEGIETQVSNLLAEHTRLNARFKRYKRALIIHNSKNKGDVYSKHLKIEALKKLGLITPDQLARMIELRKLLLKPMKEYKILYDSHPRCSRCTICTGPGHVEEFPILHEGEIYCFSCYERSEFGRATSKGRIDRKHMARPLDWEEI